MLRPSEQWRKLFVRAPEGLESIHRLLYAIPAPVRAAPSTASNLLTAPVQLTQTNGPPATTHSQTPAARPRATNLWAWGLVLGALLFVAIAAVYAFSTSYSYFATYDDEGTMMITVTAVSRFMIRPSRLNAENTCTSSAVPSRSR